MDEQRPVLLATGCHNPLCPSANWSQRHLPRWRLESAPGQTTEFAACNEACAHLAARFHSARLGLNGLPYARLSTLEPVPVH